MASIRDYIEYHETYLYLYTRALTHVNICKPYPLTEISPFYFVVSNLPGPLEVQRTTSKRKNYQTTKPILRTCLEKAMFDTSSNLTQAQKCYKLNFDDQMRKQRERFLRGDLFFLRVDRKRPTIVTSYQLLIRALT